MRKHFHKILFLLFLLSDACIAQDPKLDQLLKDKDLNTSLRLIDSMGKVGTDKDPNLVLYYQDVRIATCRRFNNDTALGQALWRKGRSLVKRGRLDEAEKHFLEAEVIFKKLGNTDWHIADWHISVLNNIANLYLSKGLYDAALRTFYEAIKVAESNKQVVLDGSIYANMGSVYLRRGDYDKADEFYKKGLAFYEAKKDTLSAALSLDNLSLVQNKKGNYDLALKYQLEAVKIIETTNQKGYIAESYMNISITYLELKNFETAREYLKKAETIYATTESKLGSATLYLNFGDLESRQGNYKEAVKYFGKSLAIGREVESFELMEAAAASLSDTYEKMNDPALALKYYKEYSRLKDTVVNVESAKQINELTERYESKQKQNEIDLLTKDKVINETKLEQNKITNMALVIGIVLTFILLSAFYFRYRDKKKANLLLEDKNKIIEEKQKEIFDSLQYARQIQKLLLANHKLVNQTLPDSFIVFKPKDIVSGDFYWAAKKDDRFYLAVCDSTGHGVPGAFMSLLNINFLNEAIVEKNIVEPNEVFNYVRKRLVDNLSQDGRQDGMDGILICVKDGSSKMTYAAANNAPTIIKNKEVMVLGADKMPIGKGEKNDPFQLYTYNITKGDQLYLFTDGFADQFGGPKGKKYKYKPMYELMLKNSDLPVLRQEELLYEEFEKWKGGLEQVDDVCILGIRL